MLALALLQESGLRPRPILVKSREHGRFTFSPGENASHLMLTLDTGTGMVALDPTCRYCQLGLTDWRFNGLGAAGIRIDTAVPTPIELFPVGATLNSENRKETVTLSTDGTALVRGEIVWGGQLEIDLRRSWSAVPEEARSENLLEMLATSIERGEAKVSDPDALETAVTVKIYIPEDQDSPALRRRIEEILYHMGRLYPLPPPTFRHLQDEDWANAWKAHYQPFRIGQKIWIQPSWIELDEAQSDEKRCE